MQRKAIAIFIVLCFIGCMLSGCLAKENQNSTTEDITQITTEITTESNINTTEQETSTTEEVKEQAIDVYEILNKINNYPLYFLVDTLSDGQKNEWEQPYDFKSNCNKYTVTGTIMALDVILKDTGIENMEDGDKITSVLGIEYTVTYNDHASKGNWIEVNMKDEQGNEYYIHSSLSGSALSSPFVNVLKADSGLDVVKTYEHIYFDVPIWSALTYPSGLSVNIAGEDIVDYQGLFMADGEIHSNDLPEDALFTLYDENGNVIAD